ncbi:GAF domain-containing SpoIIE family protein phosphatase [Pseudonocardia xishanensis]|uniref:GAF domain-containing protein n=1 Tax=Pseudonocardia xishanensis TaxID=630995 RepID=A0ABP8S2G6_9PSEU
MREPHPLDPDHRVRVFEGPGGAWGAHRPVPSTVDHLVGRDEYRARARDAAADPVPQDGSERVGGELVSTAVSSGKATADPPRETEEHTIDVEDPRRLRALQRSGLTAEPDARLDEYAVWVRELLGVPVALVSLVQTDLQVFPGMTGLPEPWATKRSTPLSHSFCKHVVQTAAPLVVADSREHPLVRDNLAIAELGAIAYAGMPLTDGEGHVLGSLCAIDTVPREWTDAELAHLRRIAAACSGELRLRLASYDADREGVRRDRVEAAQQRSFDRTRTLLLASQAFTHTDTVESVLTGIRDLVRSALRPAYVGAVVLDEQGGTIRLQDDPVVLAPGYSPALDRELPSARAIREASIVHYADRTAVAALHPPATVSIMRHLGLHSVVAVPLPGPAGPVGSIVLGWEVPNVVGPEDLLTLATVGGYAGQALARAQLLHHRVAVAHEMQNAMLTTLPVVEGLSMAARYAPADSRENVGGDWYDAIAVPGALVVTAGDIIGHALDAATVMGQVRSMLRQTAWDRPEGPPSAILGAFESANLGLAIGAAGTAVLARLVETAGTWHVTWTNAGHPPPLLLLSDGTVELLAGHDPLFGFANLAGIARTDSERDIPSGATLFLYTDGLVEHRGSDIDEGTEALVELLPRLRELPVQELVDRTLATLAPDAPDDVVAFAIRFP